MRIVRDEADSVRLCKPAADLALPRPRLRPLPRPRPRLDSTQLEPNSTLALDPSSDWRAAHGNRGGVGWNLERVGVGWVGVDCVNCGHAQHDSPLHPRGAFAPAFRIAPSSCRPPLSVALCRGYRSVGWIEYLSHCSPPLFGRTPSSYCDLYPIVLPARPARACHYLL
jgi:hypothetical protein